MVEGLESSPRAFIGLMRGKNFGKLLVKVLDEYEERSEGIAMAMAR